MSIPKILFFTLLVILAITEIYSSPAGGKGSKLPESPGGKKTADENARDTNERRVLEDIHGNSAINSQTVNKQVDAVSGDNGYIPPNSAGPSESNPSHGYRVDSPIHSTHPLSDAFLSTRLGNKPKTLTQLSEKKPIRRRDPRNIDPIKEATPSEALEENILIPDVISWKTTIDGSEFTDMKVPEQVKNNPVSYKQWFMRELPYEGYYQVKVGSEVGELKSLEHTKTIFKLRDLSVYGFVVPERLIFVDQNGEYVSKYLPDRAKENIDKFNEWCIKETGEYNEVYMVYNPSLSIKYERPPNDAGPSESKISTNPAENDLSSVDSMNEPEKLTIPSNSMKSVPPSKSIPGIPDSIFLKKTLTDPFKEWTVPREYQNDQKLYDEWFMKMMPEHAYYREFKTTDIAAPWKKVDSARIVIKRRDPVKYGFVAPEKVYYRDFIIPKMIKVPSEVKQSFEKYQEWLDNKVPKSRSYIEYYSTGLKIKHPRSLKSEEKKKTETEPLSGFSDKMKKEHEGNEARKDDSKPNKLPWDPQDIDPKRQATPIEAISREIEIPDIILLKSELEGSDYTNLEVPQHVKTNPKSYKAWFMKELPQKGYYRAKVGSNKVSELKSLEQTKTIIKLQDPTTYGFVAPFRFIAVDPYDRVSSKKIPYGEKVDLDEFNKWLHEEMPKHYELYIIYNPSLSIKYRGSLEYIGMKGPQ